MSQTSKDLLAVYADMQAKLDLIQADMANAIDSILTAEQRAEIEDIETEFGDLIGEAEKQIKRAKESLKSSILEDGESCRGNTVEAIWIQGRVKWDETKLANMMFDHPAIVTAREPGKPYVQSSDPEIRLWKRKKRPSQSKNYMGVVYL